LSIDEQHDEAWQLITIANTHGCLRGPYFQRLKHSRRDLEA
jgi:hypothetical protein